MKIIICFIVLIMASTSFAGTCGDVNGSGTLNLLDVSYIISYLYRSGPAPDCETLITGVCGDVNGDLKLSLLDVSFIISHLYRGGPEPICSGAKDIDGNIYRTIKIGSQEWMAENLTATHYRNGDAIPNVTDSVIWAGLNTDAYCEYNNDANNVAIYGRLYNWFAVNDSRNIAPVGWHVPSEVEWQTLVDFLGGNTVAGGKMKESGTTHWNSPNTGATNESGFSALPGGNRDEYGHFGFVGDLSAFWSSTATSIYNAIYCNMFADASFILYGNGYKQSGFSIRCVKD